MLYRFHPVFRQYMWGGHRLATMLNKPVDREGTYAESWEIVDHHTEQSIVDGGPFDGWTINSLVKKHGRNLLGQRVFEQINDPSLPENLRGRFPLLFKFLDCNRNLSVQVHPDDTMGSTLDPPDLGKTEAWYVVAAEPGSLIYSGLKTGVTKDLFLKTIKNGTAERCLNQFEAQPGDCILIPAGTVHALGAGLVVAEIQQASDTTFRLFDWNRVGADGKPRQLHIEKGIKAANFDIGPILPSNRTGTKSGIYQLANCDKFIMCKRKLDQQTSIAMNGCFRLFIMLSGTATFMAGDSKTVLQPFQVTLVSAACELIGVAPNEPCEMLEIWI